MNAILRQVVKRLSARCTHAAAFFACGAIPALAQTQPATVVSANAVVYAGALAGATGVIAINEAAGLVNAQVNATVIESGAGSGAVAISEQSAHAAIRAPSASAAIGANAFAHAVGAISVNQAAGAANVQRNSVVLGAASIRIEALTDSELSAVESHSASRGSAAIMRGTREASIGAGAFGQASGIVQVNQTAGAGNTTANSFVLRPPAGTFF